MTEKGRKFGTKIRDTGDQGLIDRVRTHLGEEYLDWTAGQLCSSVDGDYGTVDPRSLAAQKAWGDRVAKGGSGPKNKNS